MAQKLDAMLIPFLSVNGRREWMNEPNEFNGFVYATDAHSFIRIPIQKLANKYPAHIKTANFDSLYENYPLLQTPIILSVQALKECFQNIKKIKGRTECDECNGDGVVTCNYNHDHECLECNGEGYIQTGNEPMIYPNKNSYVEVFGSYFTPFRLHRILVVAETLQVGDVPIISHRPTMAMLFRIDDIDVCIMPIDHENKEGFDADKKYFLA
jgi:hypothetical protein